MVTGSVIWYDASQGWGEPANEKYGETAKKKKKKKKKNVDFVFGFWHFFGEGWVADLW